MGRSLPLLVVALALAGCEASYPGEPVGSFDVTGQLEANTCGTDALPARSPIRFPVEIRERSGEAFWRRAEKPLVSGVVVEDRTYRFAVGSEVDLIAPDPDFGIPGCSLTQLETVTVALSEAPDASDGGAEDAGVGDAGSDGSDGGAPVPLVLAGDNTIELIPTPGSDCTAATLAGGGPFLALPCRVEYALDGSAREPF